MEVHQVPETTMMKIFGLVVVPEIYVTVHEIRGQIISWARFEERLKDDILMRILRG